MDKTAYISTLETELIKRWGEDNIPENYGRTVGWGLLSLLEADAVDDYTLLWVDGQCWSGAGGIIRTHDDGLLYQALFRLFSNATGKWGALGMRAYTYQYTLPYQVERAKQCGCDEIVIGLNASSEYAQLYNVVKKCHLPKVFGKDFWTPVHEPVLFNGVYQWLFKAKLK